MAHHRQQEGTYTFTAVFPGGYTLSEGVSLPQITVTLQGLLARIATLPVLAFFLLGIYGKVIWMLIASVILGVGHIGIHLRHRREIG